MKRYKMKRYKFLNETVGEGEVCCFFLRFFLMADENQLTGWHFNP